MKKKMLHTLLCFCLCVSMTGGMLVYADEPSQEVSSVLQDISEEDQPLLEQASEEGAKEEASRPGEAQGNPAEDADAGKQAGSHEELPDADAAEETGKKGFPEEAPEADRNELPEKGSPTEAAADTEGVPGMAETMEELSVPGLLSVELEEGALLAAADSSVQEMIDGSINWLRSRNDPVNKRSVITDTLLASVSNTATDWIVFDLGRLGISDNYAAFLAAAAADVESQTGIKKNTPTEWHRLAVAVLAAGGDPTNIAGRNLIEEGVYNCLSGEPWRDGLNGAAWSLISLDLLGYEVPEDAKYDREDIIDYILSHEISGGGWAIDPSAATPHLDVTAMCINALVPYYAGDEKIREAVDRGLALLRSKVGTDGDVGSNCESTVWALIAFSSMGIDPDTVVSSSGKTLLDGIKKFYNSTNGGFYHEIISGMRLVTDRMATEQAIYGLIAYNRFKAGETNLFDFREEANTTQYRISAGDSIFTVKAGTAATLEVPVDTESIALENLPIGNYDAALITTSESTGSGKTWNSSFRRADGSRPVDGDIPVSDGAVLTILVRHPDNSTETWTLPIAYDEDASVKAVEALIDALPDADDLTLDNAEAVAEAEAAYEALSDAAKAQVGNSKKLARAVAKIKELQEAKEKELAEKREALAEKIRAISEPVRITMKNTILQYQQELETLGSWQGKRALAKILENALGEIAARETMARELNKEIWNTIDPLRISQKDADNVKSLMQQYAALYDEERSLVTNSQSLLDAADVISALEDGIVPARVFQNMLSTGEDFTYTGTTADGKRYTLTWEAASVEAATDIRAGVRVEIGEDKEVDGSVGSVYFVQSGSLNGNVTLSYPSDDLKGSYYVYYMNPDKLEIQSAGTSAARDGKGTLKAARGGQYFLATKVITTQKETGSGKAGTGTPTPTPTPAPSSGASSGSGRTVSGGSTSRTSGSSGNNTNSTGNNSQNGNTGNTTKTEAQDGVIKKAEFEVIQGTKNNLKAEGKLSDDTSYIFTFNGEDINNAVDFRYTLKNPCSHEKEIHKLAEEPLILCLEDAGTFPGKALLSLTTKLEDGTMLLFRYNETERKAEYVKKVEIADGKTEFTLSDAGCYFLAKRALADPLPEEEEAAPEDPESAEEESGEAEVPQWDEEKEISVTGSAEPTEAAIETENSSKESSFPVLPIGIGIAAAAAAAAGIYLYWKRKKSS